MPFAEALSWQAIALAADRRLYTPCPGPHGEEHREVRDAQLLAMAFKSPVAEFRRQAVAAYGHLGQPEFVATHGAAGVLLQALDDQQPLVRREAADAIGNALSGAGVEPDDSGEKLAVPIELVNAARAALEAHLAVERVDDVAAVDLETIGRLKYADDETRQAVEVTLAGWANGPTVRTLGAVKGLEALLRANARRPIQPSTRDLLRFLAANGPTGTPVPTVAGRNSAEVDGEAARSARIRRLAMQALQTARDSDVDTLLRAAGDADWQVRRLAAMRLDAAVPALAELRGTLAADLEYQVRFEVVGIDVRVAAATHQCIMLAPWLDDPATAVVVRALDGLPKGCTSKDLDDIVARLKVLSAFGGAARVLPARPGARGGAAPPAALAASRWHVPVHALMALDRLSPVEVQQSTIAVAAQYPAWQVRAAMAALAAAHRDDRLLLRLARDPDPNVGAAALDAMAPTKTDDFITAEIAALDSADFQLLRAAANALKGTPEARRTDASLALLAALTRLTKQGWDTSRDPRVAILQRLQEIMPADVSGRLAEFADDFDPKVRAAALSAYRGLTGSTVLPTSRLMHRYPLQPTMDQLATLPTHATITLGPAMTIEMDLLTHDAPITVARFVELVKAGYYTGLSFHRVVPNFVVQGGSPGASEYVGASRFWRDEAGSVPHTRGAVGLSTRGHDTGDGQIFIDLIDVPRLDHDYTVFARVVAGFDVVDRIVEGTRIEGITVR